MFAIIALLTILTLAISSPLGLNQKPQAQSGDWPPMPPLVKSCYEKFGGEGRVNFCAQAAQADWHVTNSTRDERLICCSDWEEFYCVLMFVKANCNKEETDATTDYMNQIASDVTKQQCPDYPIVKYGEECVH